MTIVFVGFLYLASLTHTIFVPVVVAGVIAAVAGPLVGMMHARKVPRGLGALIVMLLIVGGGFLAGYLILHGVTSEADAIGSRLQEGADEIQKGLQNARRQRRQVRRREVRASATAPATRSTPSSRASPAGSRGCPRSSSSSR